ncbi:MAG: hypothetical protein IKZ86_04995, partial [Spirochaetaceae bacterium]|nr:hypothetical protein [Spirochaetaceae bacterium]
MKKFKLTVCTFMLLMCVCSASLYAKGGTNTAPSNNQEVQANGPGSESHPILNFLKSIISKLGGKSGGGTN